MGLEFEALASKYRVHVTLTHEFNLRRMDGAPEPAYNETLEDFDIATTRLFRESEQGQVVLVETYGGRRNYHFYVSQEVDIDTVLGNWRRLHPGFRLEMTARPDPSWSFIKKYTEEYIDET